MDMTFIYASILSLTLGLLIGYPVIFIMRKLKAKQSILKYVDIHEGKSGTPTIGGIIFILPALISALIFFHDVPMVVVSVCVMFSYGLIGFLDDFIKIYHHENQGLKAYQKIIAQAGIAIIVSLYCYYDANIGGSLIIPFTDIVVDIEYWIIPLVFVFFIAITNATNLIDGLDGLCTSVSSVMYAVLGIVFLILALNYKYLGNVIDYNNIYGLSGFSMTMFGGLIAFLCYNCFPAKIFMGDTGSLAIGGGLACLFAFSQELLLVFILGLMLVVTCLSVIMQVIYFKITKGKRIWLMSPLHHHYQYKGVHENKIVLVYTMITLLMGFICLISVIMGVF